MERCVHKHLYNYMVTNQLLTPLQSGFREGDSTANQLLYTYHKTCEAVDKGKEIRAVFCDISKAFHRVWHKGLLYKLRCMGCSNHVVKWFESYLSKRRQRVVINGHQIGSISWLVSHKCLFLVHSYFSFTLMILLDFSLNVKAAPHECVIWISQPLA